MEHVLENYNEWNDKLYEEYKELFHNVKYTIWDGVVFPEHYAMSPLKIMFLNREPYDPIFAEYDLAIEGLQEGLVSGKIIFEGQKNLRKRLKEYLCVLNLLKSGELMTISDNELMERVEIVTSSDLIFNEMLPSVAYLNVKKSDGQYPSCIPNLQKYAIQGKSILKKQIEYFNPSIILGGNVVNGILEYIDDIWNETALYVPEGKRRICIWQLNVGDKLIPFVDMYHPSAIRGMSEYYLELFHALKEVERTHPGYWETRLNIPCFK